MTPAFCSPPGAPSGPPVRRNSLSQDLYLEQSRRAGALEQYRASQFQDAPFCSCYLLVEQTLFRGQRVATRIDAESKDR